MSKVIISFLLFICLLLICGGQTKLAKLEADIDVKWRTLEQSIYSRSDIMYAHLKSYNAEEAQKIKDYIDNADSFEELAKGDKLMCDLWRAESSKYPLDSMSVFNAGNRLAVARKEYNDAVSLYNEFLQQIPINIVGSIYGFTPKCHYGVGIANRGR